MCLRRKYNYLNNNNSLYFVLSYDVTLLVMTLDTTYDLLLSTKYLFPRTLTVNALDPAGIEFATRMLD